MHYGSLLNRDVHIERVSFPDGIKQRSQPGRRGPI
jgi:hypothetical protein